MKLHKRGVMVKKRKEKKKGRRDRDRGDRQEEDTVWNESPSFDLLATTSGFITAGADKERRIRQILLHIWVIRFER